MPFLLLPVPFPLALRCPTQLTRLLGGACRRLSVSKLVSQNPEPLVALCSRQEAHSGFALELGACEDFGGIQSNEYSSIVSRGRRVYFQLERTSSWSRTVARTDSSEITSIPKPKGRFNIQAAMGLAEDRAEFTKLQAVIHALAVEAKLDFELPWSQQEPMTIVKISRVNLSRPRNATTICVRSDSRATERHNQSFNIISTVSARTNLAKLIPPVEFHVAARVRPKLEGGKLRQRDHPTKILASFYHLLPIHNKWIWITTLAVEMSLTLDPLGSPIMEAQTITLGI
ncbi:hypothetical protein B0H16DRAFT_1683603 [Mycena metata]|uniref:Uncharacterized protein n=1 Tax=Mycena metata TaxID=1033252 RepID=A0AAD7NWR8_9AGAR|nr:hypothetical protein B0H16DRAFT_1683603 [Mycena metata]